MTIFFKVSYRGPKSAWYLKITYVKLKKNCEDKYLLQVEKG